MYELGNEAAPDCNGAFTGQPCGACWVCHLVAVFREVRRVLRDDGCVFLNVGDAYASAWACPRRNVIGNGSLANGKRDARPDRTGNGLKEKDLCMLPARLALALQADGWWLRQDIAWVKTAPMPESVRDRFTSSWEHVFLLAKRPAYFFDIEACKEPSVSDHGSGNGYKRPARLSYDGRGQDTQWTPQPTRQMRNSWILNPEPTPFPHFATMPSALVRRCLLAACSAGGVCKACGRQYVRQTAIVGYDRQRWKPGADQYHTQAKGKHGATSSFTTGDVAQRTTTGFAPACTCGPEAGVQPATVLDPFLGSGTTLLTAREMFIKSVGIELSPSYCQLSATRLTQGVLALQPRG